MDVITPNFTKSVFGICGSHNIEYSCIYTNLEAKKNQRNYSLFKCIDCIVEEEINGKECISLPSIDRLNEKNFCLPHWPISLSKEFREKFISFSQKEDIERMLKMVDLFRKELISSFLHEVEQKSIDATKRINEIFKRQEDIIKDYTDFGKLQQLQQLMKQSFDDREQKVHSIIETVVQQREQKEKQLKIDVEQIIKVKKRIKKRLDRSTKGTIQQIIRVLDIFSTQSMSDLDESSDEFEQFKDTQTGDTPLQMNSKLKDECFFMTGDSNIYDDLQVKDKSNNSKIAYRTPVTEAATVQNPETPKAQASDPSIPAPPSSSSPRSQSSSSGSVYQPEDETAVCAVADRKMQPNDITERLPNQQPLPQNILAEKAPLGSKTNPKQISLVCFRTSEFKESKFFKLKQKPTEMQIKCDQNILGQVVSDFALNYDSLYVIRVSFSRQEPCNAISIGIIQRDRIDLQFVNGGGNEGYWSNQHDFNGTVLRGKQIIYPPKQMEIRFCLWQSEFQVADYPNYQNVNKFNCRDFDSDIEYCLGFGMHTPGPNWAMTVHSIQQYDDDSMDFEFVNFNVKQEQEC